MFFFVSEPSILVKGNTVVRHVLDLGPMDEYSVSETLSFRFKYDNQHKNSYSLGKETVLAYIASSK